MKVEDQIEEIVLSIIRNIFFNDDLRLLVPKAVSSNEKTKTKVVSFRRYKKRFATLLRVLATIYDLRSRNAFMTKRDLFYEDPAYFGKQDAVDRAIDDACALLQNARWKLNILNTSRALIFGDLVCKDLSLTSVLDFKSNSQGTILSMEPSRLQILSCRARFILIIEKDASFQTVLDSNFYSQFAPCLIVTGKGYPDCNLRHLLSDLLKLNPNLPMFALMDPDPYGLKIYLIYKYNSQNVRRMDSPQETPTLPSLELLGVLVSELKALHLRSDEMMTLTDKDQTALKNLQKSIEYKMDSQTQTQVKCFLEQGMKAEIQTLHCLGRSFLCDVYLREKLMQRGIYPKIV